MLAQLQVINVYNLMYILNAFSIFYNTDSLVLLLIIFNYFTLSLIYIPI